MRAGAMLAGADYRVVHRGIYPPTGEAICAAGTCIGAANFSVSVQWPLTNIQVLRSVERAACRIVRVRSPPAVGWGGGDRGSCDPTARDPGALSGVTRRVST